MKIIIISKNPPGGRCNLYGLYANVLADCCQASVEIVFPKPEDAIQPPALSVNDAIIQPSDGLILSPLDVYNGLVDLGLSAALDANLLESLEAAETKFMEACGS